MSRRRNKTSMELQAAANQVDQEIARLLAQKKDLRKQISETSRKERNAHIYFRRGEAGGTVEELLSNAMYRNTRAPFRENDGQTS